jgi:hypothetical protein
MTAIFARITAQHDALAFSLSPCARLLYQFLLRARPAGQAFEFWLSDFNDFVAPHRGQGFCQKWIQAAIAQLADLGLVQIITRYSSRCFKLIAFHPGQCNSDPLQPEVQENQKNENKNSNFGNKNSKIEGSNPHSTVPSYREKIENNKPVVVSNTLIQEEINTYSISVLEETKDTCSSSKVVQAASENLISQSEEKISAAPPKTLVSPNQDLIDKAEELGVRLTSFVIGVIAKSTTEVVKNALDALVEARREGKVKNAAGFLVAAIQQGWQPKQAKHPSDSFPDGFLVAYARLIDQGIAEDVPPRFLPRDRHGEPMVRVKVTGGGRPFELRPWRELI